MDLIHPQIQKIMILKLIINQINRTILIYLTNHYVHRIINNQFKLTNRKIINQINLYLSLSYNNQ